MKLIAADEGNGACLMVRADGNGALVRVPLDEWLEL